MKICGDPTELLPGWIQDDRSHSNPNVNKDETTDLHALAGLHEGDNLRGLGGAGALVLQDDLLAPGSRDRGPGFQKGSA